MRRVESWQEPKMLAIEMPWPMKCSVIAKRTIIMTAFNKLRDRARQLGVTCVNGRRKYSVHKINGEDVQKISIEFDVA